MVAGRAGAVAAVTHRAAVGTAPARARGALVVVPLVLAVHVAVVEVVDVGLVNVCVVAARGAMRVRVVLGLAVVSDRHRGLPVSG